MFRLQFIFRMQFIFRLQFILVEKSAQLECQLLTTSKAPLCKVHSTHLSPFPKSSRPSWWSQSSLPHPPWWSSPRKEREVWMLPRVWLLQLLWLLFPHLWATRLVRHNLTILYVPLFCIECTILWILPRFLMMIQCLLLSILSHWQMESDEPTN